MMSDLIDSTDATIPTYADTEAAVAADKENTITTTVPSSKRLALTLLILFSITLLSLAFYLLVLDKSGAAILQGVLGGSHSQHRQPSQVNVVLYNKPAPLATARKSMVLMAPSKSKITQIIALVIVLVLVAAGVGALIYYQKTVKDQHASSLKLRQIGEEWKSEEEEIGRLHKEIDQLNTNLPSPNDGQLWYSILSGIGSLGLTLFSFFANRKFRSKPAADPEHQKARERVEYYLPVIIMALVSTVAAVAVIATTGYYMAGLAIVITPLFILPMLYLMYRKSRLASD
jgi:flagellar basal body-associated protein FliL